MAIRQILKDNHPVLREKTRAVKNINSGVLRLLDDMLETMREADGAGLAANQVGVSKRILLATDEEAQVYELINPRFEKVAGETVGVEGCLSVPNQYGEVPRAEKVVVSAIDRAGKSIRLEAEGLLARVLQHEIDHLEGIIFTDKVLRMLDPEQLKNEEES